MTASDTRLPVRLVAVGDVGRSAAYHVGDEAMLLGLIDTAKRAAAPVDWTVMSMDPARTAADWDVRTTSRLTFEDCDGPAERETRLAALTELLSAPPDQWSASAPEPWRDGLAAIAHCDGVVIAGGGNLNGSWPAEVFERAAVVRAARRAGRPVAITSQTIGPSFDERTRELTAALLQSSVLIGLREASSYELAIELGASRGRTVLQFDDATGLRPEEPPRWRETVGDGPFIAVTLNQCVEPNATDGRVAALAGQLVEVSHVTGATVLLVPHVGNLHGSATHDVGMAQALAAAAGDGSLRIAALPAPQHAVWIARRAELVVSARYHPVVFAIATTTPSLFLHQDHYTFVKGCGALSLAGLKSWALPVAGAAAGLLLPASLELWSRRHEVRQHLQRVAAEIEARGQRHVAGLLSVLASPATAAAYEPIPVFSGPAARGAWVAQAHEATVALDATVQALTAEVERKEADLRAAHAGLEALTKSTRDAHTEWLAERESLLRHCEAHERRASIAEEWARTLAREIERKDLDLKNAMAALDQAARQRQ